MARGGRRPESHGTASGSASPPSGDGRRGEVPSKYLPSRPVGPTGKSGAGSSLARRCCIVWNPDVRGRRVPVKEHRAGSSPRSTTRRTTRTYYGQSSECSPRSNRPPRCCWRQGRTGSRVLRDFARGRASPRSGRAPGAWRRKRRSEPPTRGARCVRTVRPSERSEAGRVSRDHPEPGPGHSRRFPRPAPTRGRSCRCRPSAVQHFRGRRRAIARSK